MLSSLGDRVCAAFRATAPDPFVLAVLLTLLTFILALTVPKDPPGPRQLIENWASSEGVWKFLAFSMQMCLILVTGHALAASRPVASLLRRLASIPRTGAQAAALVAFVAALLGVLNWGLGLVGGAIIARDVGRSMHRRGIKVHYPLLCAAGYVGLLVWHGGFSGTAPLKVTTDAQIADVFPPGVTIEPIALQQTLLSPLNLVVTGGLLLLAPLVMALLVPKEQSKALIQPIDQFDLAPQPAPVEKDRDKPLIPRVLEDTPFINLALALMILIWAIGYYIPGGGRPSGITRLTPDTVNLTMLMLGLILHSSPRSYLAAVEEGARGCAGIILQFPLYAGIMGMMHSSGLTETLSRSIADLSNSTTLPLFTFASAGVVNLFVPSGGGQWGVQGPIAVQTALDAGVPVSKIVMSVAYGDQLTNMLQPFWALPLLAITGVKARDIVGYTTILMVLAALWVGLWLVIL